MFDPGAAGDDIAVEQDDAGCADGGDAGVPGVGDSSMGLADDFEAWLRSEVLECAGWVSVIDEEDGNMMPGEE